MASLDIIAAPATAPGRAAVGIVRVSGASLEPLIEQLLGRRLPARHAVLCDFHDAAGSAIDRGLALYFPAPHSYTGEDVVELHGHGGPVVMAMLLKRCLELGARMAEPGEFTKRAFLNDRMDLAQAESVIDLIDAATTQAARCAVRSMRGLFSSFIQKLTEETIELRTLIEAQIDFPEDEVETTETGHLSARIEQLVRDIDRIVEASQQGSLLRDGMDVVLAGQPNVGKSSLLNRLTGEELAIVTDVPGTTRDVIRQVIDLDGIPVRIIDTAGLRAPSDAVESIGIARAWEVVARADLVLLVLDASVGETAEDVDILNRLPKQLPCVRVMNKIDLVSIPPHVEGEGAPARVWLSAKTGVGIDLLRSALLDAAGWHGASEGLFLARERHLQALAGAKGHLHAAKGHLAQPELLAEELRLGHRRLTEITGEFTADDLLGEIFSRFCIGK